MSAVFTVAHGMDLKNVAAIIVIILCVGTIQKTTMKTTMKRIMKRTAKEIAKSEIAAKIEGLRLARQISATVRNEYVMGKFQSKWTVDVSIDRIDTEIAKLEKGGK